MVLFPITRLPSVASDHVIKVMDLSEQLAISRTSLKMEKKTRRICKKYKYHIHVLMSNTENSLLIKCGEKTLTCRVFQDIRENREGMNAMMVWKLMTSFWPTTGTGLLEMCKVLCDLFTMTTYSVKADDAYGVILFPIIRFFVTIPDLKATDIMCDSCLPLPLFQLLKKTCTENSNIHIMNIDIEPWKENPFEELRINSFTLTFSSLFSMDCVGSLMNCVSVEMSMVAAESQELNQILVVWTLLAFRLKYMELEDLRPLDLSGVLSNIITVCMVDQAKTRNGEIRHFAPNQCNRIKRYDGVTATVSYIEKRFVLNVEN